MSHAALLRRLPQLAALPWQELGVWPTPVRRLARLGEHAGCELWLKQDDLSHPLYGGNKVRKLEPLLGEARARGCRSLVTVGGLGSNHVLACAVHGRALGLTTHAVVVPQPTTPEVRRNVELLAGLGVVLTPCPTRLLVPLYERRARRGAEAPACTIGPGGSSPLGVLGCLAGGLELGEQVAAGELPEPEVVVVALGSCGTAVGLSLGLALAGLRARVLAVRVVERPLSNLTLARALRWRTRKLLAQHGVRVTAAAPIQVLHGHLGGRYGRPTAPAAEAIALAAGQEDLRLDPVYTGKAMAGLLAFCQGPGRGRRILFWNTFNSRDLDVLPAGGQAGPLPDAVQGWLARGIS